MGKEYLPRRWWVGCVPIVLLLIAWFTYKALSYSPAPSALEQKTERLGDDDGAFLIAQEFVTDELKAPAEHPWSTRGDGVAIKPVGDAWVVRSYVDWQNDFGALIRTEYTAVVRCRSDGRWELVGLEFREPP